MLATINVRFTVDIPEGTDLDALYLDLDPDSITILSLENNMPVPDASVQEYETLKE